METILLNSILLAHFCCASFARCNIMIFLSAKDRNLNLKAKKVKSGSHILL